SQQSVIQLGAMLAAARSRTRATWTGFHGLPRRGGCFRAFNSSAMACRENPWARSPGLVGDKSAEASAPRLVLYAGEVAAPFRRASSVRLRHWGSWAPSLPPRALYAARAAFVRSLMAFASCSATAAITWSMNRFALGMSAAANSQPEFITLA